MTIHTRIFRSQAASAYNAVAHEYDKVYSNRVARAENDFVRALLLPHLREPVLDIGTGTGLLWDLFPRASGLGYDISENMVRVAKGKHPARDLIIADAWSYTPLHKYPCVVSLFGSLSYLPLQAAVHAVQRSLARDGRFFVMLATPKTESLVLARRNINVPLYTYGSREVAAAFRDAFHHVRVRPALCLPTLTVTAKALESAFLTVFGRDRGRYHIVTGRA